MLTKYGIITVPERAADVLPRTIESMAAAGFDAPALFIDGSGPMFADLEVVTHPKVGQLRNWLTALFWLYTSAPLAERFAIFEDDIIACRQLRIYLDRCPLADRTWWNLLTHPNNLPQDDQAPGWRTSEQLARGAAGLVFSRRAVEHMLLSPEVGNYIADGGVTSEAFVVRALRALNYRELVHYPSLIQHRTATSTLAHCCGAMDTFLGEDYDLLSIPVTELPTYETNQCAFERDREMMCCRHCGRRVPIRDPSLPPEAYRARCRSARARAESERNASVHSTASMRMSTPENGESNPKLGDRLERLLSSIGITSDRYVQVKHLFGLPPSCACDKRREWLNKVSDWWRGSQRATDNDPGDRETFG